MEKRPRSGYDIHVSDTPSGHHLAHNVKTLKWNRQRAREFLGSIHAGCWHIMNISSSSSDSPPRRRVHRLTSAFVLILIIAPVVEERRWKRAKRLCQKLSWRGNFRRINSALFSLRSGGETHYHSEKRRKKRGTSNILECLSMSKIAQICFSFARHTTATWSDKRNEKRSASKRNFAKITCFEWITNEAPTCSSPTNNFTLE